MKSEHIQQVKQLGIIADNIFNFLPYVRIQEPGELAKEYELWTHLIDFYH